MQRMFGYMRKMVRIYADDVEDGDAKKEERGKTIEGKDGLDICGGGMLDTVKKNAENKAVRKEGKVETKRFLEVVRADIRAVCVTEACERQKTETNDPPL